MSDKLNIGQIQISFFVQGLPKPAGSKRGFFIKKINRVVIVDANPKSRDWKTDVSYAAKANYNGQPLEGPLSVRFTFIMPRPKGHFGSGKNAKMLKASADTYPAKMPDVLKLSRAVEDALTGICWRDDAQIVDEFICKRYEDDMTVIGVKVEISEMETK